MRRGVWKRTYEFLVEFILPNICNCHCVPPALPRTHLYKNSKREHLHVEHYIARGYMRNSWKLRGWKGSGEGKI